VKAASKQKFQRARSDEAKEIRRDALLGAARVLFEERSYEALTVDAVARAARIAKGTVYLYFATKEAIFLELTLTELERWLSSLSRPLREVEVGNTHALAKLLATSIGRRPTLRRLLMLLPGTLERHGDQESIHSFKLRGARAMAKTAAELERSLPFLGSGGGFRLLLHLHALVVGVGQLAEESEAAKAVLEQAELAPFRVDFVPMLREHLALFLAGWAATPRR
jgi:AcrR family transcriptional regulator